MKVIKRDGREVNFDKQKICNAINAARDEYLKVSNDIKEVLTPTSIKQIIHEIEKKCINLNRAISVEEIQDMVEEELMNNQFNQNAR